MSHQLWNKILLWFLLHIPSWEVHFRHQSQAARGCFISLLFVCGGHLHFWCVQKENVFVGRLTEALCLEGAKPRSKAELSQINQSTRAAPSDRDQRLRVLINMRGCHQPYHSPQKLILGAGVDACPTPGWYMLEGKAGALLVDMLGHREPSQVFNPSQIVPGPSCNSTSHISAVHRPFPNGFRAKLWNVQLYKGNHTCPELELWVLQVLAPL